LAIALMPQEKEQKLRDIYDDQSHPGLWKYHRNQMKALGQMCKKYKELVRIGRLNVDGDKLDVLVVRFVYIFYELFCLQ
jgi:hypothetical protein